MQPFSKPFGVIKTKVRNEQMAKNYQALAACLETISRIENERDNYKPFSPAYKRKGLLLQAWEEKVEKIMETAPSGSGIDSGTKLLEEECRPEKLVFSCDYHHMDEHGYYDGWTEHKAIVTPSLQWNYNLRLTGRDRNGIKDYLQDTISYWLDQECTIELDLTDVNEFDRENPGTPLF